MKKIKSVSKIIFFLAIVIMVAVLGSNYGWGNKLTQGGDFTFLREMSEANLIFGIIAYTVLTIIGCVVLALPGITFAVAAGIMFGPVLGTLVCLVATTLGAMAAFVAGRFFLKDGVKPLLEKNRLLKKLLFSDNTQNDLVLLMVTRLVPLFPYNIQNFAYGITDISFGKYSLYTFVFMFPGVALFTVGAAGITAQDNKWAYFMIAVLIAVMVTGLGTFIKKKYIGDEDKCSNALILFTRVPVPGHTKTRLMPFLSGNECAALHTRIIKKVFEDVSDADADIFVFYTPEDKKRILRNILQGASYEFVPQTGDNLGDRMGNAFRHVFGKNYKKAVLVGTDIPDVSKKIIDEALGLLDENEYVINPTFDGGFYLLGMKDQYTDLWQIEEYGNAGVFEATMNKLNACGIRTAVGTRLQDIDTKEDLHEYYVSHGGKISSAEGCISCGKCTEHCVFLNKYGLNLAELEKRPELAYSCFLCGKCKEVCPVDIDGAAIALNMRLRAAQLGAQENAGPGYAALLLEKNPYKFSNYKKAHGKSVIYPGCNMPAFLPETMNKLELIADKHGMGIIYDCCQKPVKELGLNQDAENNLHRLKRYIEEYGTEEIVTCCPNCYKVLSSELDVPVISIFAKLRELGEGKKISIENIPMYKPCPERDGASFLNDIEYFIEGEIAFPYEDVQCCGLGGCAGVKEPDLAKKMTENVISGDQPLYTYCASCISSFRRKGKEDSYHLLPMILDVEENVPLGISSLINRIKRGL